MDAKFTNNAEDIKNIMNSFWEKKVDFSQVKLVSAEPVWFYLEDETKLVGYINGFIIDYGYCKEAEITNLEIKSNMRGRGYSKQLVDKFISYCKNKSADLISLRVEKDNEIAKHLYLKSGFEEDQKGLLMNLNLK